MLAPRECPVDTQGGGSQSLSGVRPGQMNSKHEERRDVSPTQLQGQCPGWERQEGRSETSKVRRKEVGSVCRWGWGRDEAASSRSWMQWARTLGDQPPAEEHPCTWARSLARSGAPSEECDAPLPYPDPSPGRLAPPTCRPLGPPKCHPLHVGQRALMNKRPIRRRGAAGECIFRFQAWHRLRFPGVQGRAGRSRLPERGHAWGQRVLKTPTSPLAAGLVGEGHRRPS